MEAELIAKKWGNSLGVIIPKKVADELGLSDGAHILATFKKPKKTVLEELAESGLTFDEPIEKMLADTRKGFSKWMS